MPLSTVVINRGPTGPGVTPAGKIPIAGADDTLYHAFPGAAVMESGRIVAAWREGTSHTENGRVIAAYSDNDGRSWSAPTELFDTDDDARDVTLGIADIGGTETLMALFSVAIAGQDHKAYMVKSTDGKDWEAAEELTQFANTVPTSFVDTGSEWLIGGFLHADQFEPRFLRTTDEGSNWTVETVERDLTLAAQPSDGDWLTVGIDSYQFTTGALADGKIVIGATLGDTQTNVVAAINATDGSNAFNNYWKHTSGTGFVSNVLKLRRSFADEIGMIVDGGYVYAIHRHQTLGRLFGLSRAPVGSATTSGWEVLDVTLDERADVGFGCRPNITKVGDTFYMFRRTDNSLREGILAEGVFLLRSPDMRNWSLDTSIPKASHARYMYGDWITIKGTTYMVISFEKGPFPSDDSDVFLMSLDYLRSMNPGEREEMMNLANANINEQLLAGFQPRILVEDHCTQAASPFNWSELGSGSTTFESASKGRLGKVLNTGATLNDLYRTYDNFNSGRFAGTRQLFVLGDHSNFATTRIQWGVGFGKGAFATNRVGGFGVDNDSDTAAAKFKWLWYDDAGAFSIDETGIPFAALAANEAYAISLEWSSATIPYDGGSQDRLVARVWKIDSNGQATFIGSSIRSVFEFQTPTLRAWVKTYEAAAKSMKLLYVGKEMPIV